MKQFLLLCLCLLIYSVNTTAQTVYEDFEGGAADLTWATFNGLVFQGPVANPTKDAVNGSDNVGKFTNDGVSDFCFGIGTLAAAADLSKNNLVSIKIYAPYAPARALIKMEGGARPIEKFIDITEANKWVKYTVDFSAAATYTGLTKLLVAMDPFTTPKPGVFYFDDVVANESIKVYETFETGNELGWLGLDGVLTAPVDNPEPNSVNSSAKAGRYVKSNAHSYSLLLAESATPFDFSVLNQIKMQVRASAPTQILLKLEGAGGPAIEKTKNIGLKDEWQEYTFDFSGAKDFTHLNKMIIFFDPGVEMSADTYYYDNIVAIPAGVCAGVVKNPNVIDDFECNRNATYVNGWDSLSVVANPASNAVNGSAFVGKYNDPVGEPWGALVIDYQNNIDLATKNQLKAKVWSSKAGKILFKLEGGSSPAKEIFVDVTDLNQWVEYTVDFSGEANSAHKKVVLFFNAGVDAVAGDIYYIDDLSWGEKVATDLENFENGAALPWEPLDQLTALHGTFQVVDNPNATGVNTSKKVGKYTKGSSPFSTVAAVAPGLIDISAKAQFNLDVHAPVGATSVIFQLESVSSGNKEIERDIKTPGQWETLSFNFEEFQAIRDWSAMKIIFNPNKAEAGAVFYFDNLVQSEPTVDPCEGTVSITNIIDDFECQRNYEYGGGSTLLTVVNNPNTTGNGSTKSGLYKDQPNEPWAALCAQFPNGIDLNVFNQFEMQVLSTKAVPVLLKLEGGSSPAKEIWTNITEVNKWTKIGADFSGEAGTDHKRACFFFNGGVTTTTVDDYYIDNLKWSHAPYDGCIMNFDEAAFTSSVWQYFPAENSGGFELVDNPNKSGINTSEKVGKAIEKASGAEPWQGMFTNLESYIDFGTNKIIKMKVLSPKVGGVTLKVERPLVSGFPGGSGDNTVSNTKANEWEELSFDFATSPTPIDEAGQYARITIIWDILNLPAQDVVYYFDDIVVDGGSCGVSTGLFSEVKLEELEVMPNPVSEMLNVQNAANIARLEIFSVYGQKLGTMWNNEGGNIYLNVGNLTQGTYFIMGYDGKGKLSAQSRFVKM